MNDREETCNQAISSSDAAQDTRTSNRHPNFSDGNHAVHVQLLLDYLPLELRDLPGIDWSRLSSRAIGAIMFAVENNPYGPR